MTTAPENHKKALEEISGLADKKLQDQLIKIAESAKSGTQAKEDAAKFLDDKFGPQAAEALAKATRFLMITRKNFPDQYREWKDNL